MPAAGHGVEDGGDAEDAGLVEFWTIPIRSWWRSRYLGAESVGGVHALRSSSFSLAMRADASAIVRSPRCISVSLFWQAFGSAERIH